MIAFLQRHLGGQDDLLRSRRGCWRRLCRGNVASGPLEAARDGRRGGGAHAHPQVSDGGIALYGFLTLEEKAPFERLIGVGGVGPSRWRSPHSRRSRRRRSWPPCRRRTWPPFSASPAWARRQPRVSSSNSRARSTREFAGLFEDEAPIAAVMAERLAGATGGAPVHGLHLRRGGGGPQGRARGRR